MSFIPYARQDISENDIKAVVAALQSERITQGPLAGQFSDSVARYCGASYAVPTTNASMALIAACRAADVGSGDIVWTTPNTFVASANCAIHCGANIDFVDIDVDTYNLNVEVLRKKLEQAEQDKRLPKAVIPVHFAGLSCDMAAIGELADQYGFVVIEDASHALGGHYQGSKVGSCEYSDMVVFSFHPVKSITAGEGGMVLTNNPDLYQRINAIAQQGMVRDDERLTQTSPGPWYYEQQLLGYNLRMSEMQAALGLSQFTRLDELISKRQYLAARYSALLADLPLMTPDSKACADSAWHLYVVTLDLTKMAMSKAELVTQLAESGVGVQVHYIPVHTQPYFQGLGFSWGDFPNSEDYYAKALSLPLYPGLTDEMQDKVVEVIARVLH